MSVEMEGWECGEREARIKRDGLSRRDKGNLGCVVMYKLQD